MPGCVCVSFLLSRQLTVACGTYYNTHRAMPGHESSTPGPGPGPASAPPAPIRSSPRLNRTRPEPTVFESPRKRRKPVPTPSPRMATRASTRGKTGDEGDGEATTPTPGGMGGSLDFSSHFPFADLGSASAAVNGNGNDGAQEQDLSSLFLQFQDEVPSAGVTLESVFGTHDTNDILELLRTIESESGAGVSQSEP